MRIPTKCIPYCPKCGRPMTMNLRSDASFVQDEGWYAAAGRYEQFLRRHEGARLLLLELGVGENTRALYVSVNRGQAWAPLELGRRALCMERDIGAVLTCLRAYVLHQ